MNQNPTTQPHTDIVPVAGHDNDAKARGDHLEIVDEMDMKKESGLTETEMLKSRFDELSRWETLKTFRSAAFWSFIIYVAYTCEGFEVNGGNSVIANLGFVRQFSGNPNATSSRDLNSTWVSAWGAMLNVGQVLSFTHIGWVADRFGRRPAFYLSFLWCLVAVILYNTAKHPAVWAVGKIFNGAGIGVLQVVSQVYVMEICPTSIRGGMIAFQAIFSNIGGIIVSAMMQNLNKTRPYEYLIAMRVMFAPVALIGLCVAFVPESPWFCARRNNKEAALKNMKRLYGNVKGYNPEEEYDIIVATLRHEREEMNTNARYRDVFRGLNLKRTFTVVLLAVASQFGGTGIISSYSTYFFDIVGLKDPFLGTIIISLCNLVAVTIWTFTCDAWGRRWYVAIAHSFLVLILFSVGSLHYATYGASGVNDTTGAVLLVLCCFWTMSWQIPNKAYPLYSAELPAAILRVKTSPITFFFNSVMGLAFSFALPPMLLALGLRSAFVYGALSVPVCVCIWFFLPETKNRSAAEIDELFQRKVPAWKWNKTQTAAQQTMRDAVRRDEHFVGA